MCVGYCGAGFSASVKSIDHYTQLRVENYELPDEDKKVVDPRLESIVDRMFQRCFDDKQFKQVNWFTCVVILTIITLFI